MNKKIFCPCCGKWLFTIKIGSKGVVYIWCRQCRKEQEIILEPLSH